MKISRAIALALLTSGSVPMAAMAAEAVKVADNNSLEEIVVTAQHEVSTVSKTPIAITAVTGDALRETGITDPLRLGESVPNTMLVNNNGLQITIRGVTSTDNTEKGDPSAGFFLDGVYIARP
jgi:iron complex outermembrane receptor protein